MFGTSFSSGLLSYRELSLVSLSLRDFLASLLHYNLVTRTSSSFVTINLYC